MTAPVPTDPFTLTGDHLGRRIWLQWSSPERWETGYVDSIASDHIKLLIRLRGGSEVGFGRRSREHSPALYLLD